MIILIPYKAGGGGHPEVVLHVCRVGSVPSFSSCTLVTNLIIKYIVKILKKLFYTEKKSIDIFDLLAPRPVD